MSTLSPHSFIHSTHLLHLKGSLRKEQEEHEKEEELTINTYLLKIFFGFCCFYSFMGAYPTYMYTPVTRTLSSI